jgi:hypothetical protein
MGVVLFVTIQTVENVFFTVMWWWLTGVGAAVAVAGLLVASRRAYRYLKDQWR